MCPFQATDNLQVGLTKLAELNKVAWTKGQGCTALSDIMHPPLFSTKSAEWQPGSRESVDVVVGSDANNHVLDEGADECCDEVHLPPFLCSHCPKSACTNCAIYNSREALINKKKTLMKGVELCTKYDAPAHNMSAF